MANIAGYFGFQAMGTASGPPNFAENHNQIYLISSSNTTAIFYGDLVRPAYSGSPTGYLTHWTAGDGVAEAYYIPSGIFVGCSYYSASQQKTIESRYWPGSDAVGDVNCLTLHAGLGVGVILRAVAKVMRREPIADGLGLSARRCGRHHGRLLGARDCAFVLLAAGGWLHVLHGRVRRCVG